MKWTEEQQTVIGLRNCSILVSAAAGSGKTAVLTERILSRILDPDHPVDVDEFVIVTFTKAAAAQMKERIGEAIDRALAEAPGNEHLAKQVSLLHHAQISTIHSFCGNILRNYFHRIGLDPAYRLTQGNEAELLQRDVLTEILEEEYNDPPESFMELLDCYKFDRDDKELENYILTIYQKAMSEPRPEKWLDYCEEMLSADSLAEWEQTKGIQETIRFTSYLLEDIRNQFIALRDLCGEPDGPDMYTDRIEADIEMLENMGNSTSLADFYKAFSAMSFGKLSPKASEVCLPEKREQVKNKRNDLKKLLQELKSDFYFAPPDIQWKQSKQMSGNLRELIRLAKIFLSSFTAKKREKSLVDYHDLEQLALEILVKEDEETGEWTQTDAAAELAEQYKEIMIDEYQDSNLIQEILLKAVSGEQINQPNIFMVGDVKQSIYRFREARPELFTSKMEQYSHTDGKYRRVDLHKNFRSREIVVRSVNDIFGNIMQRDMGGIDYREDAMLYPGADFPVCDFPVSASAEILAVNGKDSDFEYEAKIIADKIKKLTNKETGLYIWEDGRYRRAVYRDIVILMRSVKKILPVLEHVLNAEGIPTVAKRSEGFYNTKEISMVVNMLRVLDNPRQDIPLVALLRSRMFSFTDEELVFIKGKNRNKDFYDYLTEYDREDKLGGKIHNFLCITEELRKKLPYAKASHIIKEIYERTSIYEIVLTMPGSAGRGANLDMLMQKAIDFDGTVYRGLFQFIRYLEQIKMSEADEGEALITGENDNAVRIMTIHAGKGLEYPVCILAGMGKSLGGSKNQWLYLHSEFGIGTEAVDNEARTRMPTLTRNFIAKFNNLENLGEELRILYVAMTRAKEKIIFTGSDSSWEKKKSKWETAGFTYIERIRAKSFFDFIMPVVLQSREGIYSITEYTEEDILEMEISTKVVNIVNTELLNTFDTTKVYHSKVAEALNKMEQFTYPLHGEELPAKVSVSELKRQSMEEESAPGVPIIHFAEEETQEPVPGFALPEGKREAGMTGRQGLSYGTIWHQCMAGIDFTAIHSYEDVEREILQLIRDGKLNPGDGKVLNAGKIFEFFRTELGREMTEAFYNGLCRREQPFVMGVPAKEIFPDRTSEETILVQGMIDAFYQTKDGIVLIDYKTDRAAPGEEEVIIRRYQTQIAFYKKALERIIGEPVIKSMIYSFSLSKCMEVV